MITGGSSPPAISVTVEAPAGTVQEPVAPVAVQVPAVVVAGDRAVGEDAGEGDGAPP